MGVILSWFAMGGYAGFVWPAYGLTAIVLGGVVLFSWRRYRRSFAMLDRLQRPPPYPPPHAGEGREGAQSGARE
jgi:heme exporter protein CcmD